MFNGGSIGHVRGGQLMEWRMLVMEVASLNEGEWSCYRGGSLMEGKWSC